MIESSILCLFLVLYSTMASQMMRAVIHEHGGPDKMSISEVPRPSVRPNELLIRVYSTGLNRADTLQRKGLYPSPPGESQILGLEVAGVVQETHPSCSLNWSKGDKVMALVSGGGYAEYATVHESHVMPLPHSYSFSKAAAIPENWLTAYQLLHFIGQVKAGDNVLIHAGGSGVGTSLVQLVRVAGAIPYVTAGSQEKITRAVSLGAKAGFNYKTGNFSDWILQQTQGSGVNIIADCVGGSFWEQNAKSLARDGLWIVYGLLGGGNINGDILRQLIRKQATITATTLRSRSIEYKSELVSSFTSNALPHFSTGKLQPIIDSVFPLEKISEAHRRMEDNLNIGKILIEIRAEEEEEAKSEL